MVERPSFAETSRAAAVALAAFLAAAPSDGRTETSRNPEPVRIGVLDIGGDRVLSGDPDVRVEYRSFHPPGHIPSMPRTATGYAHGVVVASVVSEEIRRLEPERPVVIHSADVFVRLPMRMADGSVRGGPRRFNVESARQAMEWFERSGVRVVSMAFTDHDRDDLRQFVEEMRNRGFLMVAGTPNVTGSDRLFPASYPGVVSVAGLASGLPAMEGEYSWARLRAGGSWKWNGVVEVGSSIATARVAAWAAVLAFRQRVSADDVREGRVLLFEAPVAAEVAGSGAESRQSVPLDLVLRRDSGEGEARWVDGQCLRQFDGHRTGDYGSASLPVSVMLQAYWCNSQKGAGL